MFNGSEGVTSSLCVLAENLASAVTSCSLVIMERQLCVSWRRSALKHQVDGSTTRVVLIFFVSLSELKSDGEVLEDVELLLQHVTQMDQIH